MQANKGKDTKPELALGRLLWSAGIHYRKHPSKVPGRPDFCIRKYRLAIFVDGEFWHGRDWEHKKATFKKNREFWITKIERNIKRDRIVTSQLQAHGWKVFRFWETDIKKNPGACILSVMRYLSEFTSASAPQYIPMDYSDHESISDINMQHPSFADISTLPMAAEPQTAYDPITPKYIEQPKKR